MSIDKKFIEYFHIVSSKAALAAFNLVGKKDKIAADQAAVDSMRNELNKIDMRGKIVIGEGELDEVESKLIYNLLHFKNVQVKDVMTPRSVIVSEPADMYANEFYELQEELIFSRILLEESKESENIIGYVLKDEVLEHLLDDENHKQLKDFKEHSVKA